MWWYVCNLGFFFHVVCAKIRGQNIIWAAGYHPERDIIWGSTQHFQIVRKNSISMPFLYLFYAVFFCNGCNKYRTQILKHQHQSENLRIHNLHRLCILETFVLGICDTVLLQCMLFFIKHFVWKIMIFRSYTAV